MARTEVLKRGHYAFCAHTLLLDGNIEESFMGLWQPAEECPGRKLIKYPVHTVVAGGKLMYLLRLKRPITVEQYKEVHHPDIRPLVSNIDSAIHLLLMTDDVVQTLPDSF